MGAARQVMAATFMERREPAMSGRRSRTKGKRGEREVVALARAAGLDAERTWQTAQSDDPATRCCDILVAGRPAQVRLRGSGFGALYDALENVDMAFVRADHRPWVAVLPALRLFELLAGECNRQRSSDTANDSG